MFLEINQMNGWSCHVAWEINGGIFFTAIRLGNVCGFLEFSFSKNDSCNFGETNLIFRWKNSFHHWSSIRVPIELKVLVWGHSYRMCEYRRVILDSRVNSFQLIFLETTEKISQLTKMLNSIMSSVLWPDH